MQHGRENIGYSKRTKTRVPEEKHYWSKDDIDEDHQQTQPPSYGTSPESVGGERSRHSAIIAPELCSQAWHVNLTEARIVPWDDMAK